MTARSARDRLEEALARIADPQGEGARACLTVYASKARAEADAAAARARAGVPLGPPEDRARVPGGSSSGAVVAAADGMCEIAIGTDTGGSTRIPAALCGIVGFKPSQWRVPTDGAFPLSFTLDSIGPLARTVADCARTDAVMAGEEPWRLELVPLAGLRLGIPQGLPLEDFDATIAAGFASACTVLRKAGARLSEERLDDFFEAMLRVNAKSGFAPAEAYAIHRERLATP